MKNLILLCLLLIGVSRAHSQEAEINFLDQHDLKQGKWVFFEENGDTALVCNFKDDKVVGDRLFYKKGKLEVIRKERNAAEEEPFEYMYKNYAVKGYFDKAGVSNFNESKYNSLRDRLEGMYLTCVLPTFYKNGNAGISTYFNASISKVKGKVAKGQLMVELHIDEDGRVKNVRLLSGEVKKMDEFLRIMYNMGKWQPAFQNWNCVAMVIKIPLEVL